MPPFELCPANYHQASFDLTQLPLYFCIHQGTFMDRPQVFVKIFFGKPGVNQKYYIYVEASMQVSPDHPLSQKAFRIANHTPEVNEAGDYFMSSHQNPWVEKMRLLFLERVVNCRGVSLADNSYWACWAFRGNALAEVLDAIQA